VEKIVIVEVLYATQGRREGKRECQSTVSKCIAFVQVEGIMIHTESSGVIGGRWERVRESKTWG
jgi:hypothetical protein